ncbi:D-cysteine desulfhydrase family protein [Burkholderia sp. PU8-34]
MNAASSLNLSRFSRIPLLEGPTPIQYLARLSEFLGGVNIFVKRDDLNGLGGGGNKLRKLEFLLGEANTMGADTIITVGARQSNHARLTAAVAARAGLACELVLSRMVKRYDDDYLQNGNIILDGLFGARIHDLPANESTLAFAKERAETLRKEGRNVYICPMGGSSPVGCLGYANCASEISEQAASLGIEFDAIVMPNGSGGMQAGLVAGFAALGRPFFPVIAYTVLSESEQARNATAEKADQTVKLLDPALKIDSGAIVIEGDELGAGYGIPTEGMLKAVKLAATTEGLLLDPVYGGKAFSGLLNGIESGKYKPGQNLLFVMTGGLPGIFAYRSAF